MNAANNVLTFLIHTVFTLYIGALFLRVLLSATRADFYNPVSQFLVTITNPVLLPLRKILPSIGPIDTASWFLIFGLKALELFILSSIGISFKHTLVIQTILEIAIFVTSITFFAVLLRVILSWFQTPQMYQNPVFSLLVSITEPFLTPARKYIPPIGAFDLSALVVLILLNCILIALRSI